MIEKLTVPFNVEVGDVSGSARRRFSALILACMFALICTLAALPTGQAWAKTDPGIYTATVSATYANPDTGDIEDAGGQTNATLGQSMVEGLVQPNALVQVENSQALVTVRFGQHGLISDVRVSADAKHTGSFGTEQECELTGENADEKLADYRFSTEDDAATFRFSMYVEPMGRDVVFFLTLGDLAEGNTAGFAEAPSSSNTSPTTNDNSASSTSSNASHSSNQSNDSSKEADGTASSSATISSNDAAASATDETASADQTKPESEPLNMPLIIGLVAAAIVIIVLVAYFAAIRPGKVAAQQAAQEAEKRERLKRS